LSAFLFPFGAPGDFPPAFDIGRSLRLEHLPDLPIGLFRMATRHGKFQTDSSSLVVRRLYAAFPFAECTELMMAPRGQTEWKFFGMALERREPSRPRDLSSC
jgi:hypothetical protein